MTGAVDRRAAQVLREPWSAEANGDAVALERPVVVAAFIRFGLSDRIKEQLETPPGPVDVGDQVPGGVEYQAMACTALSCQFIVL